MTCLPQKDNYNESYSDNGVSHWSIQAFADLTSWLSPKSIHWPFWRIQWQPYFLWIIPRVPMTHQQFLTHTRNAQEKQHQDCTLCMLYRWNILLKHTAETFFPPAQRLLMISLTTVDLPVPPWPVTKKLWPLEAKQTSSTCPCNKLTLILTTCQ